MFRYHAQLLRDLCDRRTQQRQQKQHFQIYGDVDRPVLSTFLQRSYQSHNAPAVADQKSRDNKVSSDIRWLLTRSARIQRVNNAGYATFHNRIKDRVVSADGKKKQASLERQRSMCSRNDSPDSPRSRQQRLHCDVLGPKFCTDCTEIDQKTNVLRKQLNSFPRIEVHTRSLVAPQKVEKIYLSNPKQMFHQEKRYPCGCTFDPRLEITTPIVYTPHEVFERIRRKKQFEYNECPTDRSVSERSNSPLSLTGGIYTGSGNPKDTTSGVVAERPEVLEQRPSFIEEKTEPPMDLSVSVKIVHNGQRNL